MYLTREEEKALAGEYGEAAALAMELLVKLGDYFGADRMVNITSAHVEQSLTIHGDAGLEFVEKLANFGGKFKVLTTINPGSVDKSLIKKFNTPPDVYEKQSRLTVAYVKMGALPCQTCTCYYIGNVPNFGDHVAWGDTSAVNYVNSVIGARSNFEGPPAAVSAAIVGKTPNYGMHLNEFRSGKVLVKVKANLSSLSDWDALGYIVGKELKSYENIPVFDGLSRPYSTDCLKRLGAALATSGTIPGFHVVGVTPEARTREEAFKGDKPHDELEITQRDVNGVYEIFQGEGKVDVVAFGCPHLSMNELELLASKYEGRRRADKTDVWIWTNSFYKQLCKELGYYTKLANSGCSVACDACTILLPQAQKKEGFRKDLGISLLVTDSVKLAHYSSQHITVVFKKTEDCVRISLEGKVG